MFYKLVHMFNTEVGGDPEKNRAENRGCSQIDVNQGGVVQNYYDASFLP